MLSQSQAFLCLKHMTLISNPNNRVTFSYFKFGRFYGIAFGGYRFSRKGGNNFAGQCLQVLPVEYWHYCQRSKFHALVNPRTQAGFNWTLLSVAFPESPPPPYTLSCSDEHKPLGEFGKNIYHVTKTVNDSVAMLSFLDWKQKWSHLQLIIVWLWTCEALCWGKISSQSIKMHFIELKFKHIQSTMFPLVTNVAKRWPELSSLFLFLFFLMFRLKSALHWNGAPAPPQCTSHHAKRIHRWASGVTVAEPCVVTVFYSACWGK